MMGEGNKDTLLEVTQGLLLEGDLDFTTSSDIDSFDSILTVSGDGSELARLGTNERERYAPDVGTDYTDALENGEEDGSLEHSSSGQADGHEGSARTEVVNRLGVTRGTSGSYNCGVCT